jgi:hypothetical protein
VPDPDPFDPIAEAHLQWSVRWPEHADHMAAVTSVMRVQQLLLARIEATPQPFGLTLSGDETAQLTSMLRHVRIAVGDISDPADRRSPAPAP